MAYLDLSNSQTVFFSILFSQHLDNASEDLRIEIEKYRHITLSGRWYEELAEIYNISREEPKTIWMEIAYSQNKSYKKK